MRCYRITNRMAENPCIEYSEVYYRLVRLYIYTYTVFEKTEFQKKIQLYAHIESYNILSWKGPTRIIKSNS